MPDHISIPVREYQKLNDQLDYLREENRQLKEALRGGSAPADPPSIELDPGNPTELAFLLNSPWPMPLQQRKLIVALVAHEFLPLQRIINIVYAGKELPSDPPGSARVLLSNTRKSLARYGIEIRTDRDRGYSISEEDKQKIRRAVGDDPSH
jgi:hypothetical protein